jgi:hypothetical protein
LDSFAIVRFSYMESDYHPYLPGNPYGWSTNSGADPEYLMCIDLNGSGNWGAFLPVQQYRGRFTVLDDTSFLFAGKSTYDNYPVTPNAFQSHRSGGSDLVFSRIHKSGRLIWSTYFGGPANEEINYYYPELEARNGKIPFFINMGSGSSQNLPVSPGGIAFNSNVSWYYGIVDIDGQFSGTYNNDRGSIITSTFSDSLYYALSRYSAQNHPFSNIPADHSVQSLIKMNLQGQILENKVLTHFPGNWSWEDRMASITPLSNGDLLTRTQMRTSATPPPLTNASWDALLWQFPGNTSQYYASIVQISDRDCNLKYNSYLAKGSNYRYYIFKKVIETDSLLIFGGTTDNDYVPPISLGALQTANLSGYSSLFLTAMRHKHLPFLDTIGPQIQEVCKLSNDIRPIGGASRIIMEYLENGMPRTRVLTPEFAWEYSTDSVLWISIPGYHDSLYHPQPVIQTTWFRRKALDTDSSVMSISNAVRIDVRPHFAPSAVAGANAYLCPGSSYTLGGSPTANGGTPPYSYAWTPGLALNDPTLPNPEIQNAQQAAPVSYTHLTLPTTPYV